MEQIFASDYLGAHLRLADEGGGYLRVLSSASHKGGVSFGMLEARVSLWGVARHPTQLYEAAFYLLLFLCSFFWWRVRLRKPLPDGVLFGVSWMLLWVFRYFIEFLKERQEAFEHGYMMNMGQVLSLPFICAAVLLLLYIYRRRLRLKRLIA